MKITEGNKMMRKYLPVVLSVLLVIALAVPAAAGPFADVPQHHWAYEAVKQLAAYGLVIGFLMASSKQ